MAAWLSATGLKAVGAKDPHPGPSMSRSTATGPREGWGLTHWRDATTVKDDPKAVPRQEAAAGEEERRMVKAVLVGCGAMSEAWLGPARETGVELAGLVDIDPDRARQRARQFDLDGVAIGTDLDAMLALAKPDVVFDVAVPSARREIVLTALRHGCHVLTEKPLAASPEDARVIVACRARRRPHPRGDPEPPLPRRGRAASAASSPPARSARRPASTATSSFPRTSAGSARRWTTCSSSTWRSTPSIPPASSSTAGPSASSAANGSRQAPGTARAPPPPPSST